MARDAIRLDALLREFGLSLVEAQGAIEEGVSARPVGALGSRTGVSISEAELDVKVVFEEDGAGMNVRPVSAGSARLADLDPGVLSSLRARLVTVPDERPQPPRLSADAVRDGVLARPDLRRLKEIFGRLDVRLAYVPAVRRWLVDVREPGGQVLRSLQLPDESE